MDIDDLVKAGQRHARRMEAFISAGLDEDKAFDLAEEMFDRDLNLFFDDRRVCFECNHFSDRNQCTVGRNLSPFVLQECPSFALKRKGEK